MKTKISKAIAIVMAVLCLMSVMTAAVAAGDKEYIPGSVKVALKKSVTITEDYEQLFPELEGKIESIETPLMSYYLAGQINAQTLFINLFDKSDDSVSRAIVLLTYNENVNRVSRREAPMAPLEERLTQEDYDRIYGEYNYDEMVTDYFTVALKASVTIRDNYEQLLPELNGITCLIEQSGGMFYDLGMYQNQFIKIYLMERTTSAIVDAINLVKDNENVVYAEPDYYTHTTGGPKIVDKLTDAEWDVIYNRQLYDPSLEMFLEYDQILVRLKSFVTITEGYEELFPEIEIESVSRFGTLDYERGKIGNQYIALTIPEHTREAVVRSIEKIKYNPNVVSAEPNYVLNLDNEIIIPQVQGDLNMDGIVSNADLVIFARYCVGLEELNEAQLARADFDGSGDIGNIDLVAVARELVK